VVASAEASGATVLQPRQPLDLPFRLTVPADAGPSVESDTVRCVGCCASSSTARGAATRCRDQAIAVHTAPD